jgi:hypothetical protein
LTGEQIGEAGSAAGFIGTWTGNNHELDDPAGPTWLWKVADVSEIPKEDGLRAMSESLFGFPDEDDEDEDEDEDDEDEDDEEMSNLEVESDEDEGGSEDDNSSSSGDESDSDESTSFPPMPGLVPITSLYDLD